MSLLLFLFKKDGIKKMNFLIQIVLFSNLDYNKYSEVFPEILKSVREFYTSEIKRLPSFISINSEESSCLYESNKRVTVHLKLCFSDNISIDDVLIHIDNLNISSSIPELEVNISSIKSNAWKDCISDLMMADNKPHINAISDLPENVSRLVFTGIHCREASGKPNIKVKAIDVDGNEIFIGSCEWVKSFEKDFSNTHTASEMFSIRMSHVQKLLLGNNPNKELLEHLTKNKIITTDRFMLNSENPRLYCTFLST
jgi:hypothetical protein